MNTFTIVLIVMIILQEIQIINLNRHVMLLRQKFDALSTIVGQKIYKVFVENYPEKDKEETGD